MRATEEVNDVLWKAVQSLMQEEATAWSMEGVGGARRRAVISLMHEEVTVLSTVGAESA